LKDFPADIVDVHGIEVLHPDDFLVAQYGLDQIRVLGEIKAMRQRLRRPPRSAHELVATVEAQGLPQFAQLLRDAEELL